MITKAVIPAAGLGTRFLPATKAQPKEMLLDEIDEMMNHVNLLYTKISSYGIIRGKRS